MLSTCRLKDLQASAPAILPSILQCDYGNLKEEVRRLEDSGVQGIHLDVMDGNFVPNLSFGFPIVETVRRLTDLTLDVHLMISNPEQYAKRYVEAGADVVTVHAEVLEDPRPVLDEIHEAGAAAGLAINPPTPVESISEVLDYCDMVLVMSVMPGFGGQEFNEVALEKLKEIRTQAPESVLLEVDGGVDEETINSCVSAGAQCLVVGSAITGSADYSATVSHLNQLARQNT